MCLNSIIVEQKMLVTQMDDIIRLILGAKDTAKQIVIRS